MKLKEVLKLNEDKWSGVVKIKRTPPTGLFTKSAETIAKWLKANHPNEKSAMASLNFYMNRAGEKLSSDDEKRLNSVKKMLKEGMNKEFKMDDRVKGASNCKWWNGKPVIGYISKIYKSGGVVTAYEISDDEDENHTKLKPEQIELLKEGMNESVPNYKSDKTYVVQANWKHAGENKNLNANDMFKSIPMIKKLYGDDEYEGSEQNNVTKKANVYYHVETLALAKKLKAQLEARLEKLGVVGKVNIHNADTSGNVVMHDEKKIVRESIITEGHVDINVLMSIDNIIKNGKVTDTMQRVYMARIIEMLKYHDFQKINNWNEVETPASIMEYVKALPDDEAVQLAEKFKEILYVKDLDTLNKFYDPKLELAMWQKFILAAQE